MNITLQTYLLVACGGALGASLRLLLTQVVDRVWPLAIAGGTLAVNVLGSLLIGFAYVLIHEKAHLPLSAKPFLMTGFLGALTTFSTFSLDMLMHIHQGQWLHAVTYTLLSVICCVLATYAAVELARSFQF